MVSACQFECNVEFFYVAFDVEMKDAVLQVVCFRDGDTNTLLHKHVYRSPACPVIANPDAERCLQCSKLSYAQKNAKCGFE